MYIWALRQSEMNQAIIQRHQNAQQMEQIQLRFDLRLREIRQNFLKN